MDFTDHHLRDGANGSHKDPIVEIQLSFDDKVKTEQSKSFISYNRQKASKDRWKATQTFVDDQDKFFEPLSEDESSDLAI
eukprot:CAMPEP_0185602028 /NCGR_PEP_ID=MMETSP0436-20130131/1495_1 /TAXON_ID=626734 ORGANISM="Favella taraikaensis, Strain Fe Narragansett Bay" /NCGR_SAMPLE_ID=MMETSP0436 /ASSEMBLY_ACC=CAM_ASM_000390 /LENGTH=79 /DNA_ID=CAMNT_0028232107 /DNA_START=752 /DNA_END=991 /DNA_ORIENTATION=-